MPKSKITGTIVEHSSFGLGDSFVIRHSDFVIP
jgi:hypothetical protein